MTNVKLTKDTVVEICNAYQHGYHAGNQGIGLLSPFDACTTEDKAYRYGVDEGVRNAKIMDTLVLDIEDMDKYYPV